MCKPESEWRHLSEIYQSAWIFLEPPASNSPIWATKIRTVQSAWDMPVIMFLIVSLSLDHWWSHNAYWSQIFTRHVNDDKILTFIFQLIQNLDILEGSFPIAASSFSNFSVILCWSTTFVDQMASSGKLLWILGSKVDDVSMNFFFFSFRLRFSGGFHDTCVLVAKSLWHRWKGNLLNLSRYHPWSSNNDL